MHTKGTGPPGHARGQRAHSRPVLTLVRVLKPHNSLDTRFAASYFPGMPMASGPGRAPPPPPPPPPGRGGGPGDRGVWGAGPAGGPPRGWGCHFYTQLFLVAWVGGGPL